MLAALVPPGQRLGVEALSYQSVTGIAARLGIDVVPLPMDAHGLRPDGLARAHQRHALRAVYLQPTLHNPLGITMPLRRRVEVVRTLGALDLMGIEDHVCAFLADDGSPLAALAPDRVVLLDSLSKRVAPGLTLGWVLGAHGASSRPSPSPSVPRRSSPRDSRSSSRCAGLPTARWLVSCATSAAMLPAARRSCAAPATA